MANRISVENRGLEKLTKEFEDQPERLTKAARLAAGTVMREARKLVRQGLKEETGSRTQQAFTERRRLYYSGANNLNTLASRGKEITSRNAFARLWIGLNPIPARERYWGRAQEEKSGASIGEYFFSKAWIGYQRSKLGAGAYKRIGRKRFPIKLEVVEIDRPNVRAMIRRVANGTEDRFADEVVRLVNSDWDLISKKVKA